MARAPILAAGGIVMQRSRTPLIAVVRLRKRNDWVLPKGKLNAGETPRAAAEREVLEETGHDVLVREYLGVVAYEVSGRPKIVHFWRMEAGPTQTHKLMADVKSVTWLPLDQAIERLSRPYEQAFLSGIGPTLLERTSGERLDVRATTPMEQPAVSVTATGVAAEPPFVTGELPLPAPEQIDMIPAPQPQARPTWLRRSWRWLLGGR